MPVRILHQADQLKHYDCNFFSAQNPPQDSSFKSKHHEHQYRVGEVVWHVGEESKWSKDLGEVIRWDEGSDDNNNTSDAKLDSDAGALGNELEDSDNDEASDAEPEGDDDSRQLGIVTGQVQHGYTILSLEFYPRREITVSGTMIRPYRMHQELTSDDEHYFSTAGETYASMNWDAELDRFRRIIVEAMSNLATATLTSSVSFSPDSTSCFLGAECIVVGDYLLMSDCSSVLKLEAIHFQSDSSRLRLHGQIFQHPDDLTLNQYQKLPSRNPWTMPRSPQESDGKQFCCKAVDIHGRFYNTSMRVGKPWLNPDLSTAYKKKEYKERRRTRAEALAVVDLDNLAFRDIGNPAREEAERALHESRPQRALPLVKTSASSLTTEKEPENIGADTTSEKGDKRKRRANASDSEYEGKRRRVQN